MNETNHRAVRARLRIEALLTHWGLDLTVTGSRLTVPSPGFVTDILIEPVATGVRVGVRTAIGAVLLADAARTALAEPLPLPAGQVVVMNEANELALVWVQDYRREIDGEQIGNALLAQAEAAGALARRLDEECYLQKPTRAASKPVARGPR